MHRNPNRTDVINFSFAFNQSSMAKQNKTDHHDCFSVILPDPVCDCPGVAIFVFGVELCACEELSDRANERVSECRKCGMNT